MSIREANPEPGRRSLPSRALAGAAAFFATLVAAPGYAVDIPNVPLQSQAEYPPANVVFILDDSGSMNLIAMPAALYDDDYSRGTGGTGKLDDSLVTHASYGHNTIYYNPAVTYLPWMKADGTRYTGGTSYDAAYRHPTLLADAVDLSTQTFYVPLSAAVAASTNNADFHRYQIRNVNGTMQVVKSEWGRRRTDNAGVAGAGCAIYNFNSNNYDWRNCTLATPTGRSVAGEMTNYATWYSYHRSRMKVAKAGASEAMSRIGEKLRLGLDVIGNQTDVDIPDLAYEIPVNSDDGRFRGSNKSTWYSRLQGFTADGNTPLHRALQRTGEYFSSAAAAGPWGPQAGAEQLSCRQNFAILTTDGYWNSTSGFNSVGDADGTAGSLVADAAGKRSNTYAPKNPYQDNFVETSTRSRADTLADVAMDYWKRDLRTDLKNDVPHAQEDRPDTDPAFWQHMTTFGVSIGLKGSLDPKSDLPSIANGTKHWPDPINGGENPDRIDDLWHASVNGRGGFLVASNSKEFSEGLLEAFATIAERLGSASNVTANSTSFISNTRVYQASYVSGTWSGELAAYDASESGVADAPSWQASKLIPVSSGRSILTWDGARGVAFPTSAQTALLDQSTRAIAPVGGADNAAYIAGDRSMEKQNDGGLRDRTTVLGDIVDSSPVYVKDTETVFVGANDGMLHAFNALTGAERFAYVPAGIDFTKLATLSNPKYTHEYFVDGPLVVTARSATPGRNYLVGTLGRGGKGVYALDVTNPARFGANDVMWELGGGDDMGYVLGEPLVATLNGGTQAAIFGNGINSANGSAVLYVVDLLTGTVLQRIDTGVGGDNGLFTPRGWDDDGNGTLDYVFAGDLKGNVWKFDFTGASASVAFSGQPLFSAGAGQPVTADLALARDPATGKRWVFAGTGSMLKTADLTDTSLQSMYGLIDDGPNPIAKSELQRRTIAVVDPVTGNRGFEPSGTLPAGQRGWYLDLSVPTAGERVINRPLVDGPVLFFATVIPPTSNACDAGGKGYLNSLHAFSGTGLAKPFFDANGDGVFNDEDKLTANNGDKVVVGSMDPGVGMLTKPIIIRGPGRSIAVVGGSSGGKADLPVNPSGTAPRRVSWRELIRD